MGRQVEPDVNRVSPGSHLPFTRPLPDSEARNTLSAIYWQHLRFRTVMVPRLLESAPRLALA